MRRPFPVTFQTSYPSGALELDVSFSAPLEQADRELLTLILETFLEMGQWGVMSGDRISPTSSGLTLDGVSWAATCVTWRFRGVLLDPTAVSILLNWLQVVHEENRRIAGVEISWDRLASLKDPQKVQFPKAFSPVPFSLAIGDLEYEPYDVIVEFKQAHHIDRIKDIDKIMEVWLAGVNLGAYAFDGLSPSRSCIRFMPEADHLAPDRIEWYILKLRCDVASLDGLINLLFKVHHQEASILQVTIGDFP